MTSGMFLTLTKFASDSAKLQPSQKHRDMLDNHFSSHEQSRWRDFRRAVRSSAFVNALRSDDRADAKMKRYADAMNLHFSDKSAKVFKVPGSKKNHTVKYHPSQDRYSCSCASWGYAKSHQVDKSKQDCKHIEMVKSDLFDQQKIASIEQFIKNLPPGALARTIGLVAKKDRLDTQNTKDEAVWQAYKSTFGKQASIRGAAAQAILEQNMAAGV